MNNTTQNPISRRTAIGLMAGMPLLLAGTGVLAGGALLSGCSDKATNISLPIAPPVPARTLPKLTGKGDLVIDLVAQKASVEIVSGHQSSVLQYSAKVVSGDSASIVPTTSYLGPTLQFRKGQRVKVNFENLIGEDTTVHWHGLILGEGADGGPSQTVPAGGKYTYEFVVNNEPGTYWYHPHPHGNTASQVWRGLAGMIIVVDDSQGDVLDLVLVVQDRDLSNIDSMSYSSNMMDSMSGKFGSKILVNGQHSPHLELEPKIYRLRILNGSNALMFKLSLANKENLTVIAIDGHTLPKPVVVPFLVITPAQRRDILLNFAAGTSHELIVEDIAPNSAPIGSGAMAAMPGMRETEAAKSTLGGPVSAIKLTAIGRRVVVSEATIAPESDSFATLPMIDGVKEFVITESHPIHKINGKVFEMGKADEIETVKRGTRENWDFVNSGAMAHPIHIHGAPFLVTKRTWEVTDSEATYKDLAAGIIDGVLVDTFLIWPGQRVSLEMRFPELLDGLYPYHCHILEHEDAGMMRNFMVA